MEDLFLTIGQQRLAIITQVFYARTETMGYKSLRVSTPGRSTYCTFDSRRSFIRDRAEISTEGPRTERYTLILLVPSENGSEGENPVITTMVVPQHHVHVVKNGKQPPVECDV